MNFMPPAKKIVQKTIFPSRNGNERKICKETHVAIPSIFLRSLLFFACKFESGMVCYHDMIFRDADRQYLYIFIL